MGLKTATANVRFHQEDTLRRFLARFFVNRFWTDRRACTEEIVSEVEKYCRLFRCSIITLSLSKDEDETFLTGVLPQIV